MLYDAPTGNLVAVVRDAGDAPHLNAMTRFSYSATGQVLSATDPMGVELR